MIQAEGANVSASASAEANAMKVSGNTVTLNIGGSDGGFPDRILRAINPAWYERREANALAIKADSVKKTIDTLMEGCPIMTRQRAAMEAMGYRMTNEQADNFFEVASRASDFIENAEHESSPLPPEMRDGIVEGASHAYDEDAKELWSRILASEINVPGNFSKRTISILSDMNRSDVLAFKTLCSFSFKNNDDLLPVLESDLSGYSQNDGALSIEDTGSLESLGLVDSTRYMSFNFEASKRYPLLVAGRLYSVANRKDRAITVSFPPSFTKYGKELAALCGSEIGTNPKLEEMLRKKFQDSGLIFEIVPSKDSK